MALDERTLRYLATRMNPGAAERYRSMPGMTGGFANPNRPTLARALQDLGGIGGPRALFPGRQPEQAAAGPGGAAPDEAPKARSTPAQGGWAGVASSVAPLVGDYRTSPAQVLATALAGYMRGKQGAEKDAAAEERYNQLFDLKKQELNADLATAQGKADQNARIMEEIGKLPPGEQTIALLDPEGWAGARAKQLYPEPAKPVQVGNDLVTPDGQLLYRAPFAPREPREPREPPETWQTLSPADTAAMGYPEGVVVQRSSRGQLNTSFKPTNQSAGITFETPDGGTLSIGGSGGGQAVKLPQGFYMGDPSPEAAAAGITSKVAAPLPGTPEYAKATETINASTNFRAKLGELQQLYEETGTRVMPSEAKGRLESLANDLKLSYALAKGQGALQKTDEAVISSVLGAVTSPMSLLPGGQDQVRAQIGQALQSVDRDVSGLVTQYPWAKIGGASNTIPDPERTGSTMYNQTGTPEKPPAVNNGAPSPAAQPPKPAPSASVNVDDLINEVLRRRLAQ